MDLVISCKESIDEILKELEPLTQENESAGASTTGHSVQTQNIIEAMPMENDKMLDRIVEQQNHLKMIIDRDEQSKMLRKSIMESISTIERLRQSCSALATSALKERQQDLKTHTETIEKFQVAQLKSIAEDYNRHKDILAKRKEEVNTLRNEYEREEKGREAHLANYERRLENQLRERQQTVRGGSLDVSTSNGSTTNNHLLDELNNPDHIELISIDEYAPYGLAPHSRIDSAAASSRGGGARGAKGARGGRSKRRGGTATKGTNGSTSRS